MAKNRTHIIRVSNCSQQLIRLQVRPPGGDFYMHEQQISLNPGQEAVLPKDHLIASQIKNLQARQMLRMLYDSESVEDRELLAY